MKLQCVYLYYRIPVCLNKKNTYKDSFVTPYHKTYETLSTETTSWVPISTMAYLRYVPIISR